MEKTVIINVGPLNFRRRQHARSFEIINAVINY